MTTPARSLLVLTLAVSPVVAGPPVGWRNDGSGLFPGTKPPLRWSADVNVAWRTELPGRSLSSPVVVKDRVFVVADPTELVCVSAETGESLWRRSHAYADVFGTAEGARIEEKLAQARELRKQVDELHRERDAARKEGREDEQRRLDERIRELRTRIDELTVHPPLPGGDTGNTGSTPVTDGADVFTLFGTGVVSSHTVDGKRNWMRFVEAPGDGHSASPVLVDGKLVVHLRQLTALDVETGETVWTADTGARHGSPVVHRVNDTAVVVTPEGTVVRVADGRIVAKRLFRLNHSSPIVRSGVVYAAQDEGLKAVTLDRATGDEAVTRVAWEGGGSRTSRLASPVEHDGLLYTVSEQGVLEVTNAKSGVRVHRRRLEFEGGRVDPSLAVAGDRIYVTNTRGETVVLAPGREYRELARNNLGEGNSSSPAFAGSRMYVRTNRHLYCIREADDQ